MGGGRAAGRGQHSGGGAPMPLVEVVRAGPEHLQAIFELYCETAEWHVSMDPTYYVAVDDGEAAGVRNAFREALTDSSGASGAHVAVGGQGEALGFVLWSIERVGYHDTHFQAVGVIEEVYVRPASRRQAGGAGVGTALMEAAMLAMRDEGGVQDFKLQASSENSGAVAFYERLGWHTRQVLMYHSQDKPPPTPEQRAASAAKYGHADGSQQVSWSVELGVRPGQLANLRALTEEMVALSAQEPGTLVYERFVSEDGGTVHARETYRDSGSAIAHLEMFAREFGDRLMECVERKHMCAPHLWAAAAARADHRLPLSCDRNVYGEPSAELRAKLDETLPVGGGSAAENAVAGTVGGGAYLSRVGGFARL